MDLPSFSLFLLFLASSALHLALSVPTSGILHSVAVINEAGPYLGVAVPNSYEMSPLLQSGVFTPNSEIPTLDISGRRFRIGEIEKHKVIVVMTGLSMLNAGITTQLLLDFFDVSGVLHYGIAGNMNDELNIGDITIPKYWAHTGLWNWQRFGQGPNDNLSLEANGDFTRKIGYLHFGNFNNPSGRRSNYLNNIWFQPEEVFPVTGVPEERQHHFWVPVDETYHKVAKQIQDVELESCVNATSCLTTKPKVVLVKRGISANIFLDNAAYRAFLFKKFKASPVDMESASVALVCLANNVPFIAIRALSDLAGGSSEANEAVIFSSLAATNAVIALTNFIKRI